MQAGCRRNLHRRPAQPGTLDQVDVQSARGQIALAQGGRELKWREAALSLKTVCGKDVDGFYIRGPAQPGTLDEVDEK
jgi:hypothetical protein